MVKALDRKLLRDLALLRGQIITIALVVACGISSFILMQSTFRSLQYSRSLYYEQYKFADVFAHLKRAPQSLTAQISQIPGVASVQPRVVEPVRVPVEDMLESASGSIVSLPDVSDPGLNAVYVREGRVPVNANEVLVLETFAKEHALRAGDHIPVVLNGTLRSLTISGVAMSPEFVFALAPGDITVDEKRFAVLWMQRDAIAPAFQMTNAFNDVCLKLESGASLPGVLQRLDALIAPYGGLGAISSDKQLSNFSLNGELQQLETMATVVPTIFLGVAAFLLNVVLARLVTLQRPEIATLKAVGYSDLSIALHYLKLVTVIVLGGAAVGLSSGVWFGQKMVEYYGRFFKFPYLAYRLEPEHAVWAILISFAAAVVGALGAARHIANLTPAAAMLPPTPATYRPTLLERLGLFRFLSPATRMVVREVERRPWRTTLSAIGIAMAVGIVVVGQFWKDATDFLIYVQFNRALREDLSVAFLEPRPERVVRELSHLPGVIYAEGLRVVPVRFRSGPRFRDSALWGLPKQSELRRILNQYARETPVPERGVLLTKKLGEILGVLPGDRVEVELREGNRRTVWVTVESFVDESFGLQGYVQRENLDALLREEGNVSLVLLHIDPQAYEDIHRRLKKMPAVASVTRRDNVAERFEQQSGEMMRIMTFILTLFAVIIAIGVVYNNARVALSVRSRDLATLRVLGFTHREISGILLGELSVQVLLGIPLGLWFGTWLSSAMMSMTDPETYRFPVVISGHTYAVAATVALASSLISALLVRHRLNQLDLISVLKTRE